MRGCHFLVLVVALAGCKGSSPGAPDADADTAVEPDTPVDLGVDPEAEVPDVPVETPVDVPSDPPEDPGLDEDDVADVAEDPEPDDEEDAVADAGTDPSCTSPTGGTCHLVEQCGCMSGFYCDLLGDPTTCTMVENCLSGGGTADVGDACSSPGDCRPGTVCLEVGGSGQCYEWCRTTLDCSDSGSTCTAPVLLTIGTCGRVPAPYYVCDPGCPSDEGCDLFATGGVTGCSTGEACIYDPVCDYRACITAGTGGPGASCLTSGCIAGTGCYSSDGGSTYVCHVFCDSSHPCTSGTCTTFGSTAFPALGVCT